MFLSFRGVLDFVRSIVKHLLLAAVAIALVYAGKSFSCTSIDDDFSAMKPAVEPGGLMFLDKRAASPGKLKVGDRICFLHTYRDEVAVRAGTVAGLAGDLFSSQGGVFTINGSRPGEDFAPSLEKLELPQLFVPADHVLVTFQQIPPKGHRFAQHLVSYSDIRGRIIW